MKREKLKIRIFKGDLNQKGMERIGIIMIKIIRRENSMIGKIIEMSKINGMNKINGIIINIIIKIIIKRVIKIMIKT
jgi:hypothetical protein